MGHYYSEMACQTCGHMKCICDTWKEQAIKEASQFTVRFENDEFTVIPFSDLKWMHDRVAASKYDTREEAEASIPLHIQTVIDTYKNTISTLTNKAIALELKLLRLK